LEEGGSRRGGAPPPSPSQGENRHNPPGCREAGKEGGKLRGTGGKKRVFYHHSGRSPKSRKTDHMLQARKGGIFAKEHVETCFCLLNDISLNRGRKIEREN